MTLKSDYKKTINLKGWKIKTNAGLKYIFPSVKIKYGQQITLYTGKGTDKLTSDNKKIYWQRTREVWRDKGDIFTLKNKHNETALTYRYGDKKTKTTFSKTIFFIHHSTGQIYWDGGMKKTLEDHNYKGVAPWWDGNTDPQDFYSEFSDSEKWAILDKYSIIIFKSCFPASDITSDEMLNDYKTWYRQLYTIYSQHPDKLFVPMSTPPLLKKNTTKEAAKRALEFEKWLLGEYKNGYKGNNLAPFGLHSLLSDNEGYLKSDFIADPDDNHPNAYSGEVVGEAMWKHLDSFLKK
jgi:hypothetical protein